jgi:hypothetical protein
MENLNHLEMEKLSIFFENLSKLFTEKKEYSNKKLIIMTSNWEYCKQFQ